MTPLHFVAVRSDGLRFMTCVGAALGNMDLLREFDRLKGTTLVSRRAPIEVMVDQATGKQDADIQAFLRFVWNDIFTRTPSIDR
jgi:hypothetical protein